MTPLDLTAVVLAYNIIDPVTAQADHRSHAHAAARRPLAERLRHRRRSSRIPSSGSSTRTTHWPIEAADPGLRGEKNADTWIVTNWLNGNRTARRFLDGKDPYHVPVNSAWLHVQYPTDVFAARNSERRVLPAHRRGGRRPTTVRRAPSPPTAFPPTRSTPGFIGILDLPTADAIQAPDREAHQRRRPARGRRSTPDEPRRRLQRDEDVTGRLPLRAGGRDRTRTRTRSRRSTRRWSRRRSRTRPGPSHPRAARLRGRLRPGERSRPATRRCRSALQLQTLRYTGDLPAPPTPTTTTTLPYTPPPVRQLRRNRLPRRERQSGHRRHHTDDTRDADDAGTSGHHHDDRSRGRRASSCCSCPTRAIASCCRSCCSSRRSRCSRAAPTSCAAAGARWCDDDATPRRSPSSPNRRPERRRPTRPSTTTGRACADRRTGAPDDPGRRRRAARRPGVRRGDRSRSCSSRSCSRASRTRARRSGCNDDSAPSWRRTPRRSAARFRPGTPVAIVRIPSIGLARGRGARDRAAASSAKGPGHVVGTPLPGQPGNAVVAGRRTLYGGPFGHLGSLHRGDRIHVTTGEGNATYRVSTRRDSSPPTTARSCRITATTDSRCSPPIHRGPRTVVSS